MRKRGTVLVDSGEGWTEWAYPDIMADYKEQMSVGGTRYGNAGDLSGLTVKELRAALALIPAEFDGCEVGLNDQEYVAGDVKWSQDTDGSHRRVYIEAS